MITKTDPRCITWCEVLVKKVINAGMAKSLIGFTSWNQKEIPDKLGKHITDILQAYDGKVIAKDVIGTRYNDIGLLFLSNDIPEDVATEIFDIIMNYEQEEVYDTL